MPKEPGKKIDGDEPASRMKSLLDVGQIPDMPPIDAQYLVDYLFDVGPSVESGTGSIPLRSEHIIPWQDETGIELQLWQAQFLRNLSREYLVQAQKSEKPDCPPPFGFEERRALVAAKIDSIFG